MDDFTLVIPTYNRPHSLSALLSYLQAEQARFRILVLDSSEPRSRARNKTNASSAKLNVEWIEFREQMHPFDKFREGVHRVVTPFCALCADDDLVTIDCIERSIAALRDNPRASVAQGYSFSFLCRAQAMDLMNILYFTPTIAESSPLARLAKLFDLYQAATYGNYRTGVLRRIFDQLRPIKSILARELLGSALAAIEGEMIRLPCFGHGRSMDASERYEHWHPLEWFAKDPQSLFEEYGQYRKIVVESLLDRPDNHHEADDLTRIVDLIHLRYFFKHAPESTLGFIARQEHARVPFEQYWPDAEIHQPLIKAASITIEPTEATRTIARRCRTYILHSGFVAPTSIGAPSADAVESLLNNLDHYRLRPAVLSDPLPIWIRRLAVDQMPMLPGLRRWIRRLAVDGTPILPGLRRRFHRLTGNAKSRYASTAIAPSSATVSVLLCNYNDSRYLPYSLRAICEQTRRPDEVIILDDGSNDNSIEIIEDFARRYCFIRVLKNDENRGLLYSINRALAAATCDFVVWAAADDLLLPTFLERSLEVLRRHDAADLVFSELAVFQDGSEQIESLTKHNHGIAFDFGDAPRYWSGAELRERLKENYMWLSANTVVARRTCLIEWGGFDQELRWHADYFAFWVIALRRGAWTVPETLAAMRQRPQTYSSVGTSNRSAQIATLGRLLDKMTSRGWRDIGFAAMVCPSLLSPFGTLLELAAWRQPHRWPFAITFGLWWTIYRLRNRSDQEKLQWRLLTAILQGVASLIRGCLIAVEKTARYLR